MASTGTCTHVGIHRHRQINMDTLKKNTFLFRKPKVKNKLESLKKKSEAFALGSHASALIYPMVFRHILKSSVVVYKVKETLSVHYSIWTMFFPWIFRAYRNNWGKLRVGSSLPSGHVSKERTREEWDSQRSSFKLPKANFYKLSSKCLSQAD